MDVNSDTVRERLSAAGVERMIHGQLIVLTGTPLGVENVLCWVTGQPVAVGIYASAIMIWRWSPSISAELARRRATVEAKLTVSILDQASLKRSKMFDACIHIL